MPGLTQPSRFSICLSKQGKRWMDLGGRRFREDRGGLGSHNGTSNGGQGKIQTAISLSQTPGTLPGTSTTEMTPVAQKLNFQKAAVKMQSGF